MTALAQGAIAGPDLRALIAREQADPVIAETVRRFHRLSYDVCHTWRGTMWLGVPVLKHPCDLWIYQELIAELRPSVILETGTGYGGSAYFFATLCELLGHGEVLTVDCDPAVAQLPNAIPRLHRLIGDSVDPALIGRVRDWVAWQQGLHPGPVLISLDSAHDAAHVLAELHAYADLVTPGSFLVVEDTNIAGHPVLPTRADGPLDAVTAFLAERADFAPEPLCERYLLTFHPHGWLRRLSL